MSDEQEKSPRLGSPHIDLGDPGTSRLAAEILAGTLDLRADSLVRWRFYFSIGEQPVGIYRVRSLAPRSVRVIRAWNISDQTYDPFLKKQVECRGRQFHKASPGEPLFLVEFNQAMTVVTDKVAFRSRVARVDPGAILVGAPPHYRLESLDVSELELLG